LAGLTIVGAPGDGVYERRDSGIGLAPIRDLNLFDHPEDPAASRRGLGSAAISGPPNDHVRTVALLLLHIFWVCLLLIIVLATVTAWYKPDYLKDMIGFYGTVVATLGTLLGGVVAFYFARR
jgi:hypothetical protein